MSAKWRLRFPILLLIVLCAVSATMSAQTATGRVVGTVYDVQGAVVPDARISVTNTSTGVVTKTVTNSTGYYEVLALPIGSYKVTVEKSGFQTGASEPRHLQINESLRFDFSLSVGSESQTVSVSAEAVNVETVNPTIGESVSSRAVVDLPLNGRNVLTLATLQPGVTAPNPGAGGNGFSISGGRTDAATFLLDGGLNTNLMSNTVVYNPNPDAVAEFRILTSNYTAEYGRNAGGIISVVTKSGTNELHGSAYDYLRNDAFNANSFFNKRSGLPINALRRNQFGGTLGGPVTIPHVINGRNRLFFFVSYQGQRQSKAESADDIGTFTPAQLQGDFSGLTDDAGQPIIGPFLQAHPYFQPDPAKAALGIIDPSRINPVSAKMIAAGMIPTSPTGFISSSAASKNNYNELTAKTDYTPTEKDRIAVTIGFNRATSLVPYSNANVPGYADTALDRRYFGSVGYTRTFSPTMLNEFRFTAARRYSLQDQPVTKMAGPADFGIQINPDIAVGPPYLSFWDSGLSTGFGVNGPTYYKDNTFTFNDTLTWNKGKSTWKFGGYLSFFRDSFDYAYVPSGGYSFYSGGQNSSGSDLADFLLGNPNYFEQGPAAANDVRTRTIAVFGQNEWRATSRLTLTLGLRYEYNQPKTDTLGRTANLRQGFQSTRYATAPMGLEFPGDPGAPVGMTFPDKNNFAPRFGFAWDPTGKGKTSVRGGFGVFYDILNARDNIDGNGGPPYAAYGWLTMPDVPAGNVADIPYMRDPWGSAGIPNPFPVSSTIDNWAAVGFLPFQITTTDAYMRSPYVYQYNLSVQRRLPGDIVAQASYVGSSSKKLQTNIPRNQMLLGTTDRALNLGQTNPDVIAFCETFAEANGLSNPASACPFAGSGGVYTNGGFASYNSLQASLTKDFGKSPIGNTYFTLSYTYGHSIDNTSGRANRSQTLPYYDRQAFRASSDFDVRHSIVLSGGWELPFDRAWKSGPKALVQGWTLYPILSWRTGFPLNVNAGLSGAYDDPGPSGAGDPGNVNALLVEGSSRVHTLQPGVSNLTYFDRATFTNDQYGSDTPCAQQASPYVLPSGYCAMLNPSLRTYGGGRNILYGPGRTNLDLAIAKRINLTERLSSEFRFEAFNAFNHAEWYQVNTSITSSKFGKVTSTYDPRILQFAVRLRF